MVVVEVRGLFLFFLDEQTVVKRVIRVVVIELRQWIVTNYVIESDKVVELTFVDSLRVLREWSSERMRSGLSRIM